jgi:hypothetical protein
VVYFLLVAKLSTMVPAHRFIVGGATMFARAARHSVRGRAVTYAAATVLDRVQLRAAAAKLPSTAVVVDTLMPHATAMMRSYSTSRGGSADGAQQTEATRKAHPEHWLNRIPNKVKIVEVGPRDGLQNEKQAVDTQTKKVLIEMLADAGLTVVEATSFVNPKAVPQMADAYQLFTSIDKREGVSYPVLVPNVKGLEQALTAGVKEIAVFVAASQLFSQRNLGCTIDVSFDRYKDVVRLAEQEKLRVRGYVSCVLGCPYEGALRTIQEVLLSGLHAPLLLPLLLLPPPLLLLRPVAATLLLPPPPPPLLLLPPPPLLLLPPPLLSLWRLVVYWPWQ